MPLAPDFIVRSVSREPWKANRRPSKPCQDWLVELELCVQHLMSLHQVYKCVVPFKTSDHLLMLWAIPLANSGGDSGAKTLVPPCIRHLSLAGGLTAQAAIFEVPQARAHGQSKIIPPRLAPWGQRGVGIPKNPRPYHPSNRPTQAQGIRSKHWNK